VKWTLKSYMDNLEAQGLIFKPQGEPHCKECSLDFDAANQFQAYVQSFAFQRQRVGILYGKYNTETGGVLVEVVYEPPQEGGPNGVVWSRKDPEIDKADALATLLGLQRVCLSHRAVSADAFVLQVGWIFSHAKREYLFSAEEVMVAAELQYDALHRNSQEGKSFVTLKLTGAKQKEKQAPLTFAAVTEEGQSALESFQVSDQAIKLHAKNLYAKPSEEEPNLIRTKEKILMHTKTGGREDRDKLDTDVVLTRVRGILPMSYMRLTRTLSQVPLQQAKGGLQASFPVENRPETPVTQDELKRYLNERKGKPWVQQISDFHFLLFVSNFLDMRVRVFFFLSTLSRFSLFLSDRHAHHVRVGCQEGPQDVGELPVPHPLVRGPRLMAPIRGRGGRGRYEAGAVVSFLNVIFTGGRAAS
jgi:hypothetical protein